MTSTIRRGNLQGLADRLDPEYVTLPVNEAFEYLSLRSGSAWGGGSSGQLKNPIGPAQLIEYTT